MPDNITTINNPESMRSAEQAAALVKSTAEATATALDIKYIQRDILEIKQDRNRDMSEIKQSIKELANSVVSKYEINELSKIQSTKLEDHETRIRGIETNMFKWLGAISILSIILSVIIAYVLKIV